MAVGEIVEEAADVGLVDVGGVEVLPTASPSVHDTGESFRVDDE